MQMKISLTCGLCPFSMSCPASRSRFMSKSFNYMTDYASLELTGDLSRSLEGLD